MKNWLFVLLLVSHPAIGGWEDGEFLTGNKLTDGLWISMNTAFLVDWAQTRHIADHPERWAERNTDLGRHPTTGEVNRYFLSYALGVNALYFFTPKSWKPYLSSVYIIPRYDEVDRNYEAGIKLEF